MSRTPGVTLAAGAVGVMVTLLTVMLAMRFMMSAFPAAERRKDEPPWATLVSLTDPLLRPLRRLLQLVRPCGHWQTGISVGVLSTVEPSQSIA